MEKRLLLGALLAWYSLTAHAQTQAQLNAEACGEYQAADRQLNTLYQQVLKLYAQDVAFLKSFKASQLAWLKFRDAQLEAVFPTQPGLAKPTTYGSVYVPLHGAGRTHARPQPATANVGARHRRRRRMQRLGAPPVARPAAAPYLRGRKLLFHV